MNTPLHTAITQHLAHGAAAQADPGTDSLVDQALLAHSRPADLDEGGTRLFGPVQYVGDEPPVEEPARRTIGDFENAANWMLLEVVVFCLGALVGIIGSHLWPLGWAQALGG